MAIKSHSLSLWLDSHQACQTIRWGAPGWEPQGGSLLPLPLSLWPHAGLNSLPCQSDVTCLPFKGPSASSKHVCRAGLHIYALGPPPAPRCPPATEAWGGEASTLPRSSLRKGVPGQHPGPRRPRPWTSLVTGSGRRPRRRQGWGAASRGRGDAVGTCWPPDQLWEGGGCARQGRAGASGCPPPVRRPHSPVAHVLAGGPAVALTPVVPTHGVP